MLVHRQHLSVNTDISAASDICLVIFIVGGLAPCCTEVVMSSCGVHTIHTVRHRASIAPTQLLIMQGDRDTIRQKKQLLTQSLWLLCTTMQSRQRERDRGYRNRLDLPCSFRFFTNSLGHEIYNYKDVYLDTYPLPPLPPDDDCSRGDMRVCLRQ